MCRGGARNTTFPMILMSNVLKCDTNAFGVALQNTTVGIEQEVSTKTLVGSE